MTLLRLDALTRRYGHLTALHAVTLTVNTGDRLAVTGPNGAGKSTLLGLIDGTISPSNGVVSFAGRDITAWSADRRARAGIARVFQHPQVSRRHTVVGNISLALYQSSRLGSRLLPSRRSTADLMRDWARDLGQQVGLDSLYDTTAGQLAYGHLRQLDLAMALASQPSLLLLDEPTAGLSPAEADRVTALIRALPATLAVLLIEHDPQIVAALATRTLRLRHGSHDTSEAPA